MAKVWVTSDNHFGHEGMYKFVKNDGTLVRPHGSAGAGDADMVARWNAVVSKEDKVYHLGDVAFSKRHLDILHQMNGTKVLIKGNHDRLKLSQYSQHFKDVRGVHVIGKCVMTHVPIHPESKARWNGNIHGHLHSNIVKLPDSRPDPWYYNACVEVNDFTPVLLDTILLGFMK